MKLHRTSPLVLLLCIASTSSLAVTNGTAGGDGGVMLRANVPMGTVLGTGDGIAFEYQTRTDAAVLVFNIDSQGFVHLLYPTGSVEVSRALQTYPVPADGAELVVDAATGVEFVFALAVADPTVIDAAELDRLRGTDTGGGEPYRVDGDPFVAANMIAGELVRGVSHRGAYFGYTYFYVNERVDYPCYLCGACDGTADDPACTDYRVVQNFDRRNPLTYPLKRAYETVTGDADVLADEGAHVEVPPGSDVDVNFYPYGVEARAVDPFYSSMWNDYWWYDPIYWGVGYPYYGPGWSWSIGWGWGWGWWGGYYCSGWYAPCGWGYYDGYYDYYPGGSYATPEKFKAKYKSASTLTETRTVAAQRDGSLRIASKDVQRSLSRPAQSSVRSKTGKIARTTFGSGKSKGAIDAARGTRVKTSIGGRSFGSVKSTPRGAAGGSSPRVKSTGSARKGVANTPRGGGGYKSRGVSPGTRGSSRPSGGRMGSSPSSAPRAKSTPSRSYSAPSSRGGSMKSSAPRSAPSSGVRGGSRGKGR